MQPITKKEEVALRGGTSSEFINKMQNNITYDINKLYQIATEHGVNIPKSQDALLRENYFLQKKLIELETRVSALENPLNILEKLFTNSDNVSYQLDPTNDKYVIENPLSVDIQHRVTELPISSNTSKVHLLDSKNKVFIPKSLDVDVYENNTLLQTNNDVKNMFNKSDKDIWMHTTETANTVTSMDYRIDVKLPQNIINHQKVNTIALHPAPSFSFSITNIEYKDASGNYHTIETFPRDSDMNLKPLTSTSDVKFVFPDIETTEVRIHINQPNYFDESTRKFVVGFQEIDISYTRYANVTDGSALLQFDLTDGTSFDTISNINPLWGEGGVKPSPTTLEEDLVNFGIKYIYNGTVKSARISEDRTSWTIDDLAITTIYLETTLKPKGSGLSPLLSGVEFEYTTK